MKARVSVEKSLDLKQRLYAVREHLRLSARPEDPEFESEVAKACLAKVAPIIAANSKKQGEGIIAAIGGELGVKFEEVRTADDIKRLENHYVHHEQELGFAMLADELKDPSVDALLFQRMVEKNGKPEWVAVLNLQETEARAYWSRPHEIVHRIAEPPQGRLAFFRHRFDDANAVERIIDAAAADIAFPRSIVQPLVRGTPGAALTWDIVRFVQHTFAPTASLLSVAKACVRYAGLPCYLLMADMRGRKSKPSVDVALRVVVNGYNELAERLGYIFHSNMRAPRSSPIFDAYATGNECSGPERLDTWVTSSGSSLPGYNALTSAIPAGRLVYGLVNLTR